MDYDLEDAMVSVERDEAAAYLAGLLRRGSLVLLLGAGVSAGIGLPTWEDLVSRCEAAVGISSSEGDLMRRMDAVRRRLDDREEYKRVVRDSLYRDLSSAGEYPDELLRRRMLIALGALVMNSARGSVADVLTLNFDDVLEWYLHLHGYSTQTVTRLPSLIANTADVRIMHIHGFLPLNDHFEASDWILLSHRELVSRLGDPTGSWPVLITNTLQSRVLLAVGTSMNDMDIDVLLDKVSGWVGGKRPIGYVLEREVGDDRRAALAEVGVKSVSFKSYEEIPDFLLDICRRAAADAEGTFKVFAT